MKSKLLMSLVLLVGVLIVCGPMLAHHGATSYANTILVLKDATVTKLVWANPHTIVLFDVKDDKGTVAHWAGEAGSPSAVGLFGWAQDSLAPRDAVTVLLY